MNGFGAAFMWHFRREWVRMAVLGLLAAVFVAILLSLSNSVRPAEIQALFEKLPPAVHAMLGLNEGEAFSLSRWVGVIHNHPVWLIVVLSFPLAAALRGIAGGIDDGTLELVLAQPLGRSAYYLALAAVVGLGTTVVLGCSTLGALVAKSLVILPEELPSFLLLQLAVSAWALALAVAGIGLLISVVGAGGGRPGSIAIGIVVGMFFLRFVSDMVPSADWLRWFGIFGYHDSARVMGEGLVAWKFAVLLAVGLVCAGGGLWVFRRKQLTF
jgi:hypothetical protein